MPRVLVATAYGRPPVLALQERASRDPGPGEVRLRVVAVSLNPWDLSVAAGVLDPDGTRLPVAMASEAAGTVVAVGEGAVDAAGDPIALGDEVYGTAAGAAADEVTAAAKGLFRRPSHVDPGEAAGLLLVGATAEHALEAVGVHESDTVLVHGGSGSVGSLAIQLAIARGARVVATAGAAHDERLRGYGAVPVRYGEGLADRVRAAAPEGVTAAIDTVGTDEALAVSLELLADPTRLVSIANFSGAVQAAGGRIIGAGPGADPGREVRAAARPRLAALLAEGAIRVPIARRYALADGVDAYALLATGHAGGKLILEP
jgi:NADPH:quinone reductase-like Zn-dependent oxidoreductase